MSKDVRGFLDKAGAHWMRKDKQDFAYKLIRGGKSTWVRVNRERAQKVLRMIDALEHNNIPDRIHRSRSPRRGLEETPSASSQDTVSDGDR